MKINAEFDQRVVIHSANMDWIDSPMLGVSRRPLDRIGDEVARATSIVRYGPNSQFSPHVHTGGEEFFVLSGVFQDEHGNFPAGSYIRNPPESSHTPRSDQGCVIFVKLWQFEPTDRRHVRLNTNVMQAIPHREYEGVSVIPLYYDEHEEVGIQYWEAGAEVKLEAEYGAEVLVLEGGFNEGDDDLIVDSWLRLPIGSVMNAVAGDQGAKVWMKRGHLNRVSEQTERIAAVS